MKLHRLGRTSFRAVKSKRDYLLHRNSYNSLYLSRLDALKEFAFMKAIGEHCFHVPNAVDCNRHCVVMSLIQGYPLVQVKQLENPDIVFETIIGLAIRLAEHGLIHCDFNEFNIMVDDDEMMTIIDFPQMVSVSHRNAHMYFDRDVECIYKFFSKRLQVQRVENVAMLSSVGFQLLKSLRSPAMIFCGKLMVPLLYKINAYTISKRNKHAACSYMDRKLGRY